MFSLLDVIVEKMVFSENAVWFFCFLIGRGESILTVCVLRSLWGQSHCKAPYLSSLLIFLAPEKPPAGQGSQESPTPLPQNRH